MRKHVQFQTFIFYGTIRTQITFIRFFTNVFVYVPPHVTVDESNKWTFKAHEF